MKLYLIDNEKAMVCSGSGIWTYSLLVLFHSYLLS